MNKIINKTKAILYVFSVLVLNIFIVNGVKAEKWKPIDSPADVPTEIIRTTSGYSIIVGILFVSSLLALIISMVSYLKIKDEQKKEKAKRNMWRFFIIFTVIFILSIFFLFLFPTYNSIFL